MLTASRVLAADPLVRLIQPENFVGWCYAIDYDTACVLTNDLWKANALGIPHTAFLVAASFDPARFAEAPVEERDVLLLRVVGSAPLPQDDDLVRTRVDHLQAQTDVFAGREFDDITRGQLQYGGLKCRVLGTFYARDGELCLGSDLESFSVASRLNVYRPRGAALELVVNHVDPTRRRDAAVEARRLGLARTLDPLRIGTVRYTSTDRLHRRDDAERVAFRVQPVDFLARRTAALGMTRTGKSNLVKVVVAATKRASDEGGARIGQLIYDLDGEYANANAQDGGSIADLYPKDTVRYRLLDAPGFVELRTNFYEQLGDGLALARRELEDHGKASADYARVFLNLSFDEPDQRERAEHERWRRQVAAYRALLFRAGFEPPPNYKVYFAANQEVRAAVDETAGRALSDPVRGLLLSEAVEWFETARRANRDLADRMRSSSGRAWIDDGLHTLLDMLCQKSKGNDSFISGHRLLADSARYHSPKRSADAAEEIYRYLADGKIVILDLSVGDATIRDRLGKDVAARVFHRNMGAFTSGKTPPNVVIYVEEAHNLIGRDAELTDTWPRIAKEGGKFRIALVYATQEVSSVHPNILANTENWFVSHLNNAREVAELARFYDFDDFSRSLVRAQDVGFTRVKTLSSPFVVLVQVDRFDPRVERTRALVDGAADDLPPASR